MYVYQGENCWICLKHYPKLCVDHDHQTGKVRGLLCKKCNGLLHALENSNFLNRGMAYLNAGKSSLELALEKEKGLIPHRYQPFES